MTFPRTKPAEADPTLATETWSPKRVVLIYDASERFCPVCRSENPQRGGRVVYCSKACRRRRHNAQA